MPAPGLAEPPRDVMRIHRPGRIHRGGGRLKKLRAGVVYPEQDVAGTSSRHGRPAVTSSPERDSCRTPSSSRARRGCRSGRQPSQVVERFVDPVPQHRGQESWRCCAPVDLGDHGKRGRCELRSQVSTAGHNKTPWAAGVTKMARSTRSAGCSATASNTSPRGSRPRSGQLEDHARTVTPQARRPGHSSWPFPRWMHKTHHLSAVPGALA